MTDYVRDAYTAGSGWRGILTARSPELGGPIVKHPSVGGDWYLVNNRAVCRATSSGKGVVYYSGEPASADYTVEADIYLFDDTGASGVVGRLNITTGEYYNTYINKGNNELWFGKRVGGVLTRVDSYYAAFSSGTSYQLRLEMIGTAIKVYVNGVQRISVTDSAITAKGRGGIRAGYLSDTYAGAHIDNFRVFDASTPSLPASTRSTVVVSGL